MRLFRGKYRGRDGDRIPPLAVTEEMDLRVWGVCRYVIHEL